MIKKLHDEYRRLANQSFQRFGLDQGKISEDVTWENDIYQSPSIRYGHLEYFRSPNGKIEVLHCVFFPSYFKPLPIFGFDIISLNDTVTGLFCDFTAPPMFEIEALSRSLKDLKHKYKDNLRTLPEWANFFSENFVCIRPDGLDENTLIEDFLGIFRCFIGYSNWRDYAVDFNNSSDTKFAIEFQNKYSINQRKNEKTSKALTAYIGEEKAKKFIEEILFPVFRENNL
jgi:phycocyanobilin:ferredoxin oxidoreductase